MRFPAAEAARRELNTARDSTPIAISSYTSLLKNPFQKPAVILSAAKDLLVIAKKQILRVELTLERSEGTLRMTVFLKPVLTNKTLPGQRPWQGSGNYLF